MSTGQLTSRSGPNIRWIDSYFVLKETIHFLIIGQHVSTDYAYSIVGVWTIQVKHKDETLSLIQNGFSFKFNVTKFEK